MGTPEPQHVWVAIGDCDVKGISPRRDGLNLDLDLGRRVERGRTVSCGSTATGGGHGNDNGQRYGSQDAGGHAPILVPTTTRFEARCRCHRCRTRRVQATRQ